MEQPHLLMTTRLSLESTTTTSTSGYSSISFSSSLEDQPSEANDEDTSQNSNLSFGSSKETSPPIAGVGNIPAMENHLTSELSAAEAKHKAAHESSPRTGRPLPKWDTCDSEDSEGGGYSSLSSSQPSPYWTGHKSEAESRGSLEEDDISKCLSNMCLGTPMTKIKRQNRTSVKTLYLDSSRTLIRWKPSKKGNKAKISIRSVKEVREGANTEAFRKYVMSNHQNNDISCFSIIHGTGWESLDLITDSQDECRDWVRGLRYLICQQQEEVKKEEADMLRDNWLKAVFKSADKSGDGLLSMDEVQRLLHKMNVNLSKRKVKQLFKEADTNTTDDNEGLLNFDEFVCFYKRLSTRPELLSLLQEYSGGKDFLMRQDFELFLRLEQGEKQINGDIVKDLMERFEPVPENVQEERLGIDGFTRYLMSEEGDFFNASHRVVNQDMTQPLCHYFIASSHNTYLLGDQVMSHSSVDVYGAVLQSGCRCVEMDCWDGKDGEPVVYHGYTLTTKIKCRDVITVISKYAFVSSPYPVILSIENHCNLQQQKKLANYLIDILGDKLIIQDWDLKKLPSPEALKGKILIKTQKLPLDHDEELEAGEVSEEDSADELDEDFKLEKSGSSKFENLVVAQWALKKKSPIKPTHAAWQRIAVKARESSKRHRRSSSGLSGTLRKLKASRKKSRSESSESEGGEEGVVDLSGSKRNSLRRNSSAPSQQTWKKKSIILSKQLSDLVKYTRSVAFSGFPADMPCWELPSLGEMRASNLVATRSTEFVNFTSQHLCRVYPSAYRIDSSNYNPQPMWNCGCQLVALNYQTEGRVMQIARAKFNSNGNCGYVLKPEVMREEVCSFEPNLCDPVTNQKKLLTIRIISGQQLPKPPQSLLGERGEIIDPYVEVELIGLPVDCFKAVTKTVQDNGFNPNWNQTVFFTVHMPDIALLRFVVWDEDPIGRDYIGQATFAVRSLSPGYRHIHLEGLDHATLFVHVMIENFDEKALQRLSRARSNNKSDYARTKSVDLDIPVVGYSGKLSPRRSKIPLTQRFNIMRRHTAASIFMVGDPQTSPVISHAKRQSASMVEGMTEEEQKDREEFGKEAFSPVAMDTIIMMLEVAFIPTDIAMDGSIKIPIKALQRVYSLNIPVSAIITGIREKKLSLACGKVQCLDAVEGNIASNRSSIVNMYDGGEETLEEFSFLWHEQNDSLQDLVAPGRLQHPEHAFVGLENIAEHKSLAGSADDLSSSTESSDDEDDIFLGPMINRSGLHRSQEPSYNSTSHGSSLDEEGGNCVRDSSSQGSGLPSPDLTFVDGHQTLKGQENSADRRSKHARYKNFETKVDVFAGEKFRHDERSRLSIAMEELGTDLMGIIRNLSMTERNREPVHDNYCECDLCVVDNCRCDSRVSTSDNCHPTPQDGQVDGRQNAGYTEDENRNWSRIYESKETIIGDDNASDHTCTMSSTDTLLSDQGQDGHSESIRFPEESRELREPELYSPPDRTTSNENVASLQLEAERIAQERDIRKQISEKYGVTLRDRSKNKKVSVLSMRFKSKENVNGTSLPKNLDQFLSDVNDIHCNELVRSVSNQTVSVSSTDIKRQSSYETTTSKGRPTSKYGTLGRWKRFTTGAFLSKSMPDIASKADGKGWYQQELKEPKRNGDNLKGTSSTTNGEEKKQKVFFFWKI